MQNIRFDLCVIRLKQKQKDRKLQKGYDNIRTMGLPMHQFLIASK